MGKEYLVGLFGYVVVAKCLIKIVFHGVFLFQADGSIRRLRLKVVAGHTLAKKDIFGARLVL